MNALILAGGEGSRIKKKYPNIPKGLIPIFGMTAVEFIYNKLKDTELFEKIYLNVKTQDEKYFSDMDISCLAENNPIGNAGAIKRFSGCLGEIFLVHHCDTITDINCKELHSAFLKNDVLATMVLAEPEREGNYGIPLTKENRIIDFQRKPASKELSNTGIYFFKKEIVSFIEDGFQDLDKDLFPKLIQERQLGFYIHKGFWIDIGG